jgi:hypothetical protein
VSVFRTEEGASESSGEIVRLVSVITSALIGSSGCVTNAIASWVMEEGLEIRRPCSRLRASVRMVREGGVEPPRPCGHRILSPARLPFRHSRGG